MHRAAVSRQTNRMHVSTKKKKNMKVSVRLRRRLSMPTFPAVAQGDGTVLAEPPPLVQRRHSLLLHGYGAILRQHEASAGLDLRVDEPVCASSPREQVGPLRGPMTFAYMKPEERETQREKLSPSRRPHTVPLAHPQWPYS